MHILDKTKPDIVERIPNDAEWLRIIANDSDTCGDNVEDNQSLWPETKLNLLDIADIIESLNTEITRLRAIEQRAKACLKPGSVIPCADPGKPMVECFVEFILNG